MKKVLASVLVLCLLFTAAACAESDSKVNEIVCPGTSCTADFDNDGEAEEAILTSDLNEYGDGSFTLTVNGQSCFTDGAVSLDTALYAMKIGFGDYWYGTMFMVQEYGPSDDPLTYCFVYADGRLSACGMIPALCTDFRVDEDGLIHTRVRARMIGTWARPATYMLADGMDYDSMSYERFFGVCEVPQGMYPMGMILDLKQDIDVYPTPSCDEPNGMLFAGGKIILAATDDASLLYVCDMYQQICGWLPMKHEEYLDMVMVNGRYEYADDVFGNILYAD